MDKQVLDKLNKYFGNKDSILLPKGQELILANQEPSGVYFLLDGIVEQYDITPEGNKITVNIFKPPAFFPMSWAINKTPNDYFYAALADVRVKQADADETVLFLQDNPDVTFDLLSRVYKGTDTLLKRLVLATSSIASSRLIFELLIEAHRFGAGANESKKVIKIKHNNLAARSGLARETVSRELHKLEKSGAVELTKQGIVVDIEHLTKKLDLDT